MQHLKIIAIPETRRSLGLPEKQGPFSTHTTGPVLHALTESEDIDQLFKILVAPEMRDNNTIKSDLEDCKNQEDVSKFLKEHKDSLNPNIKKILNANRTVKHENTYFKKSDVGQKKVDLLTINIMAALRRSIPVLEKIIMAALDHPLTDSLNIDKNYLRRGLEIAYKEKELANNKMVRYWLNDGKEYEGSTVGSEGSYPLIATLFFLTHTIDDPHCAPQNEVLLQEVITLTAKAAIGARISTENTEAVIEKLLVHAEKKLEKQSKSRFYFDTGFNEERDIQAHYIYLEAVVEKKDTHYVYYAHLYNLGDLSDLKDNHAQQCTTTPSFTNRNEFIEYLKTLFNRTSRSEMREKIDACKTINAPLSAFVEEKGQALENCTLWNLHFMLKKVGDKESGGQEYWMQKRQDVLTEELRLSWTNPTKKMTEEELKLHLLGLAENITDPQKRKNYLELAEKNFDIKFTQEQYTELGCTTN